MIEKITGWTATVFAILIAVVAFVGVLLMFRALSGELWSEKAAGWAQAIGSVAAILVTVVLFKRQNEALALQSMRERKLDLFHRRQATYALCVRTAEMIDEICEAFFGDFDDVIRISEYFDETFSESAFEHMAEALSVVPHHDLGSYLLTAGVMDLRDAITRCKIVGTEGKEFEGNQLWIEDNYNTFARIRSVRETGMNAIDMGIEKARNEVKDWQ